MGVIKMVFLFTICLLSSFHLLRINLFQASGLVGLAYTFTFHFQFSSFRIVGSHCAVVREAKQTNNRFKIIFHHYTRSLLAMNRYTQSSFS